MGGFEREAIAAVDSFDDMMALSAQLGEPTREGFDTSPVDNMELEDSQVRKQEQRRLHTCTQPAAPQCAKANVLPRARVSAILPGCGW